MSSPWTLSVSLLKEVTVTLHTADGHSSRVPISPNAKRIQLLAYLAWQRDQQVTRSEILEKLFRPDLLKKKALSNKAFTRLWRSSKEERRQLSKALATKFDTHKQLLRRDIRVALMQLGAERGSRLPLTNRDPFKQEDGYWGLSSLWHVVDLENIEAHARVIREAQEQNRLIGTVSASGKAACDALMAAYPGDFLEEMLRTYPEEFRPWQTCWVREPYTLYREDYLQALWSAGEYEWQTGRAGADGHSWECFERAADLFRRYAFYACNSRLDTGVSFRTEQEWPAYRVFMSEEALCRCLSVYQAQGREQDFEECKQAYMHHMERISGGIWKPGEALREIIQAATR